LVFIPMSLVLALSGDLRLALLVLVPLATLSGVVEFLLKPSLVGRRMQMHGLLVFLSLLGGVQAFGAIGLLIGPFVTTAFLTLIVIYREQYRHWLLPSEVTVPVERRPVEAQESEPPQPGPDVEVP
jgi:predicted PurR-regulated permease PerM